jgi:hypothetical protein
MPRHEAHDHLDCVASLAMTMRVDGQAGVEP